MPFYSHYLACPLSVSLSLSLSTVVCTALTFYNDCVGNPGQYGLGSR